MRLLAPLLLAVLLALAPAQAHAQEAADDDHRAVAQVIPPFHTPNEGAGVLSATIRISSPEHPGTAAYRTADAAGAAGSDYVHTSGRISYPAGESEHTVEVGLVDDGVNERELKSFLLVVEGPELHGTSAELQIADDDWVHIHVAPTTVTEGAGAVMVPVRLSVPSTSTISTPLSLEPWVGGARPELDALLRGGTRLTFAPGVTESHAEVEAVDDVLVEGPEEVLLRHPYGIQEEQVHGALISIVDDDTADVAAAAGQPLLALGRPALGARRDVTIGARCLVAAGSCAGRLTLATRGHSRRRALALGAGRARTLRFRLPRAVARAKRVRVRAAAVVRDRGGRSGRATATALLRR